MPQEKNPGSSSRSRICRRKLLQAAFMATASAALTVACSPKSGETQASTVKPIAASTPSPTAAPTPVRPSPASQTPAATPDTNIRFTVAVGRDLGNGEKDPYFTHTSLMVHEPLIKLGDGLEPAPGLAEKWSISEDKLTWTFHLRRNVMFTDGTPFNAEAVIRNIERNIKISPRPSPYTRMDAKEAYGPLASMEKVDEYTLKLRHSQPYSQLESTMSNFFSAMFSPGSFTENGDFKSIPATTGPFRLAEWQRGQHAILERNEAYWGARPYARQIRVRVIADSSTRVSALEAGEVDAIVELGAILPAQARQLRNHKDILVATDPISITQYLYFNCSKPPFDDVRLRQAVVQAIDLQTVVKDLVLGFGEPGRSLLSPISKRWFSPKGGVKHDPAEAASLARSALAGKRVEVVFPFSPPTGQAKPYKEIAEYMQAVLRPIGIDLRLQNLEYGALTDVVNRGEWQLRFSQMGWANGDPHFIFGNHLHSKGGANTTSKGGYHNQEVDSLVDAGRNEFDYQCRYAIYERLQELAATEAPVISLYHEVAPYAYRRNISGLRHRANFQPTFDTMTRA